MNASPQPTVVPVTGTGWTSISRADPAVPSTTSTPFEPNVTTSRLPRPSTVRRSSATSSSSGAPGQPTIARSTQRIVSAKRTGV
jgi:hypothetical protein